MKPKYLAFAVVVIIGYYLLGWWSVILNIVVALIFEFLSNIPKDNCKYCGGELEFPVGGYRKARCVKCGRDQ